MKIRCDVCDKAEASVFCSADEAALCDACDRRVHHANKLATKHMRFSLLQPSFKHSPPPPPLCDICQERRAFMFCQEDRAILCRECDLSIHKANEYAQKHNRFLLTGVKLSASSELYPTTSSRNDDNIYIGNTNNFKKPGSAFKETTSSSPSDKRESPSTAYSVDDNQFSGNGSISTSSISEYLDSLPGWRVDDFLDPVFSNNGFCSNVRSQQFI